MLACKEIAQILNLLPVTAGTNGKGSCVALCEAMLLANGYRVGSFYSPHLFHFNERICINHQPANENLIQAAFHQIEHIAGQTNLTYFEKITLAALMIFRESSLDAYVLEVGLGGRYDPTNIVDADVAVITSIDLDHTHILGNTREDIGFEKAGIFRANKPAIYGGADLPQTIEEHAKQIHAKFYCFQRDYFYQENVHDWSWWSKDIQLHRLPKPKLLLQNAATAIAALLNFTLPISNTAIQQGLKNVYLPGRFQVIEKPLLQIFDVAHNPAAAKLLAKRIKELPCEGKTYAVVGMLKDKDMAGTLMSLFPLVDYWYLGSLHHERGASASLLAHELEKATVSASSNADMKVNPMLYDSVKSAYDAALANAGPSDRLIIFGSFHTVGSILQNQM
jgi:dihydrofolate synthase / folylpolyglutamate synthase